MMFWRVVWQCDFTLSANKPIRGKVFYVGGACTVSALVGASLLGGERVYGTDVFLQNGCFRLL